ncbi:adenosylcobinamide-GDP ribazoletransferase [Marinicrinis sediminis]|uniref:Adenosylcobinamide-GDP ribazoletransferase n=1 Tax=Marinicrinis sediminis TaxID=1652465 RepID=A0ABW5R6D3_9BACL
MYVVFVRWLVSWLQAGVAAIQFLTVLPIPMAIPYTSHVLRRSVVWYPAAGAVIGMVTAVTAVLLDGLLPSSVGAVLVLIVWVVMTGGLHLDGLMDSADGLLSHRSRERKLTIMKDSRVGAMGVIVCVFYVLLKGTLMTTLLEGEQGQIIMGLLLIPVWSRAFLPVAMSVWPYAGQQGSLGASYASMHIKYAFTAICIALLLTVFVRWGTGAEPSITFAALPLLAFAAGVLLSIWVTYELGGLTGDIYGALNELIELILLLAWTGYVFHNM